MDMIKHSSSVLLFLLTMAIGSPLLSQNLVPNYSFDDLAESGCAVSRIGAYFSPLLHLDPLIPWSDGDITVIR